MDADQFHKIAEGFQSIVTILGVIVGGAWVLFTFRHLGATEKARAELAELNLKQHETEETLAERQPILAIDLRWETVGVAADDKRFVSLPAKLRNDGKRPLQFQDTEVLISRLSPETGEPAAGVKPLRLNAKMLEDDGTLSEPERRILRSGQTRTVAFLIPSLTPGNYLVQLQAEYEGLALKKGKFRKSTDDPIFAFEQSVVTVRTELPAPIC
jgi:hypothetical protein